MHAADVKRSYTRFVLVFHCNMSIVHCFRNNEICVHINGVIYDSSISVHINGVIYDSSIRGRFIEFKHADSERATT